MATHLVKAEFQERATDTQHVRHAGERVLQQLEGLVVHADARQRRRRHSGRAAQRGCCTHGHTLLRYSQHFNVRPLFPIALFS